MLLYISLLGFAIALLLVFFNKNRFRGNYYLVGFFLLNALYGLTFDALFFSTSIEFSAIMHGNFMPLLYLSGPFAYFYVRSLITDCSKLKKSDLVHFIPFLILFIGMIPYYFTDFDHKTDLIRRFFVDPKLFLTNINFIVPQRVNIISRQAIMMVYFAYAHLIWIKNKELVHQKTLLSGLNFKHVYSWVQTFLTLSLLISIGMLILSVNAVYRFNAHLTFERMTFLMNFMGVTYFLLNSSLFLFPEILYGLPRYIVPISTEPTKEKFRTVEFTATTAEATTSRLQLSEDYLAKIEQLISCYIAEKPFLNPEFSLTMIASETNLPLHHLSYYFNNILQVSFSEWRNRLRIEFAVSLLKKGFAKEHSLNAVSLESGFSSQVTFIRAFKNHTGQTPGEHLKLLN